MKKKNLKQSNFSAIDRFTQGVEPTIKGGRKVSWGTSVSIKQDPVTATFNVNG